MALLNPFASNGFGLFDVHGNVWEWCRDAFFSYPEVQPREGDGFRNHPALPPEHQAHTVKIHRGGSWYNPAAFSRSAVRSRNFQDYVDYTTGVRPILSL